MSGFIEVTIQDYNSPFLLPIGVIKAVYPCDNGAFIVTNDNGKSKVYGIKTVEDYQEVKEKIMFNL